MSGSNRVNIECVQGTDWTVQIQCLDDFDNPKPIKEPARMDVKDQFGSTLVSLSTSDEVEIGGVPTLAISDEVAIVQLHLAREVTENFPVGVYSYDLFTTVDGGGYIGDQAEQEIAGLFIVLPRITESF